MDGHWQARTFATGLPCTKVGDASAFRARIPAHPPRAERSHKPHAPKSGNPPRSLPDAPDHHGFYKDNMPAFLMRPVKTA